MLQEGPQIVLIEILVQKKKGEEVRPHVEYWRQFWVAPFYRDWTLKYGEKTAIKMEGVLKSCHIPALNSASCGPVKVTWLLALSQSLLLTFSSLTVSTSTTLTYLIFLKHRVFIVIEPLLSPHVFTWPISSGQSGLCSDVTASLGPRSNSIFQSLYLDFP